MVLVILPIDAKRSDNVNTFGSVAVVAGAAIGRATAVSTCVDEVLGRSRVLALDVDFARRVADVVVVLRVDLLGGCWC